MFALSHDYRIMKYLYQILLLLKYFEYSSKKGFICMNEVELGFPLPPGMNAVCQFYILYK